MDLTIQYMKVGSKFLQTCDKRQSAHGRKGIVARGVKDVQPVRLATDAVHFTVEILNGGCVFFLKAVIEEAGDDSGFSDHS